VVFFANLKVADENLCCRGLSDSHRNSPTAVTKITTFIFAPKVAGENFRSLLIVAGEDATPLQLLFAYRGWLLKVPLPRSGVLANRELKRTIFTCFITGARKLFAVCTSWLARTPRHCSHFLLIAAGS
jgi:hypothetical protein